MAIQQEKDHHVTTTKCQHNNTKTCDPWQCERSFYRDNIDMYQAYATVSNVQVHHDHAIMVAAESLVSMS